MPEVVQGDAFEFIAQVLGDDTAAREDCDVLQHCLAPVAETGGLDGGAFEDAAEFVDNEGRQGFALDVLSAMIRNGFPICAIFSRSGTRSFIPLIFFS